MHALKLFSKNLKKLLSWGPGVKLHFEYVIMPTRQVFFENMARVFWGLGSVTSTLRLLDCYSRHVQQAAGAATSTQTVVDGEASREARAMA